MRPHEEQAGGTSGRATAVRSVGDGQLRGTESIAAKRVSEDPGSVRVAPTEYGVAEATASER